jgi:hypothetical protein
VVPVFKGKVIIATYISGLGIKGAGEAEAEGFLGS